MKLVNVNEKCLKIEEVVDMICSSIDKDDMIHVVLPSEYWFPEFSGHFNCEINSDILTYKNELIDMIYDLVDLAVGEESDMEEDFYIEDYVNNNFFKQFVMHKFKDLGRLSSINAPDVIIDRHIALFALYFTLNQCWDDHRFG